MKGLGETAPFHRFTNPRRDKLVYFWSWGSYFTMYPYTPINYHKTVNIGTPESIAVIILKFEQDGL